MIDAIAGLGRFKRQPAAETHTRAARTRVSAKAVARVGFLCAVSIGVACAVGFRLWGVGGLGFNSDEAVYTGQAAALMGDPHLARYFSPFRAHPLLVQTMLAILFRFTEVTDVMARTFVVVAFGVPTVVATALLGRRLYGSRIGLLAGMLLAVLPYHVFVSRQVTLDVPLALFSILTLWSVYYFALSGRRGWLFLSAPLFGLAILAKESGVLLLPVIVLFLLWSGARASVRWRDTALWIVAVGGTVAPFALTRLFLGGETTGGYFFYQLLRDPNHHWWYFLVVLWEFATPTVVATAGLGLGLMIRRRSLEDKLLLSWFVVFGAFFQSWPTKLFPYLIVLSPVLVIASATAFFWALDLLGRWNWSRRKLCAACFGISLLFSPLILLSLKAVSRGIDDFQGPFEADVEVQSFAGAREVASWIGANTPQDSVFLTIGPSLGNILSFYGHRDWFALSVSQNPRSRNPAYRPIPNPDLKIRSFDVHYAIWDAYSADRSTFYSQRMLRYVRRYNGTLVFATWLTEDGDVRQGRNPPAGARILIPVYDLVGGDPL
jgi:hypothetical protein